MDKIFAFLFFLAIAIIFGGIVSSYTGPIWDQKTNWDIETKEEVKEAIRYFSNDSDKVRFRNISKVDENTWCGEANLPSREGGMLGFSEFVIHDGNIDDWPVGHTVMDKYCSEWRENLMSNPPFPTKGGNQL